MAENIDWIPNQIDKEILFASHKNQRRNSSVTPPNKVIPSDILQIMKVMGYENFTVLQLPESRFFDDD